MRVVRILKDRVRPFTQPFSERRKLRVWIREPIREDHRGQVKFPQPLDGLGLQSLIVFVNDRGRVWNVSSSVALPSHMEVRIGVFGEPREEKLEERIHVFTRLRAPVDYRSVCVLVGEPDADGLIDEEDVKVIVPAVWVPCNILSVIRDLARPEFEQQPNER